MEGSDAFIFQSDGCKLRVVSHTRGGQPAWMRYEKGQSDVHDSICAYKHFTASRKRNLLQRPYSSEIWLLDQRTQEGYIVFYGWALVLSIYEFCIFSPTHQKIANRTQRCILTQFHLEHDQAKRLLQGLFRR